VIEATLMPVPEVDATIASGEIDDVKALAGCALFRAVIEAH
jgi:hypothetical protein